MLQNSEAWYLHYFEAGSIFFGKRCKCSLLGLETQLKSYTCQESQKLLLLNVSINLLLNNIFVQQFILHVKGAPKEAIDNDLVPKGYTGRHEFKPFFLFVMHRQEICYEDTETEQLPCPRHYGNTH